MGNLVSPRRLRDMVPGDHFRFWTTPPGITGDQIYRLVERAGDRFTVVGVSPNRLTKWANPPPTHKLSEDDDWSVVLVELYWRDVPPNAGKPAAESGATLASDR